MQSSVRQTDGCLSTEGTVFQWLGVALKPDGSCRLAPSWNAWDPWSASC